MLYDKIIIGAGLYGLYSALFCGKRGEKVIVLEIDDGPFRRATYINQARVHMGYHYPRSYSTAIKSAHYFERFCADYGFCIHSEFDQVYATSANFSWTNAEQFRKFCKDANIMCADIAPKKYFNDDICDGTFLTREYTYDAQVLKEYFLENIAKYSNIEIRYNAKIQNIEQKGTHYKVILEDGKILESDFILNSTYASVNQVSNLLGFEPLKIKYELCEIILCTVSDKLKNVGLTVMDGPFFSIMPFGKTGYHSLTSVTFTPHMTSFDSVPTFECQVKSGGFCSSTQLGNCNDCPAKPQSAWDYMSSLARKYIREEYGFSYITSLFSMKPILMASEIDDSRPTVIKEFTRNPIFISVLSGKINTVYDLDEVLKNGK
ncbi:FAD-dependent oxidoreductase [Desulfitobacterium metallireducens]|uniref:Amino acid oxidase n=1 Tax=Desulfitobacterium metallireducens DSM 15288 TaxID=871968 RepID=W0EBC1_9FIRM|nr:FAD-dependent oxidoreductase [Desulfitobacterium metallireducens]AHF08062.1 amino acid oxidase [Desulfitobacterium metallireducens DSM 15288]